MIKISEVWVYKMKRDNVNLYFRGDIHLGNKQSDIKAWQKSNETILNDPIAFDMGMGDFIDCYDMETEVLTRDGFKQYSSISVGDEILTYNNEEKICEWQPIIGLHKHYHDGDMYHIKNKNVDILVTPNHRVLVSTCQNGTWCYYKVKRAKQLTRSVYRIPIINEISESNVEKKYPDALIKILGWIICEGWLDRGHYWVSQSKKHRNYVREIERCLKQLGWEYYKYTNKEGVIMWRLKTDELQKILADKIHRIPRMVFSLPKSQKRLLLYTLIKGDGGISGVAKSWSFLMVRKP